MNVFVSHKSSDSGKALEVANVLKDAGHTVYLDIIDDGRLRNGRELSDYLRECLTKCDSLIAVISNATQASWWVPWEIGVATEKDYPLSSFVTDGTSPPEYLRKWPVLKSLSDVAQFAQLVKSVETRARSLRLSQNKSSTDSKRIAASEFHAQLKSKLGQ